jgi:predicted acetyltransferase
MAASRFSAGPPADDAEIAAYGAVVEQVYNSTDDARRGQWLGRVGHENIRVVRDGTTIVGGLILIPMGQWFGGRSVPMTGVAAVAVLPEHRGRRAATELMSAAVREMRAAGVALSSLYPATQPLYRAVGYERAGVEYRTEVQAQGLHGGDRVATLRAATIADEAAIDECDRRRARAGNGCLDRSAYIWERFRRPISGNVSGYVVDGDAGVEGHVYYVTKEVTVGHTDFALWCPDVCATTAAAARRIVGFFADHGSMTGEIAWRGSPGDPILAVLREQHAVTVKVWNTWMLRVLDVAAALSARGYAPGVSAEVHLDVTGDDVLPENAGRWLVRVERGRADVSRGGRGTVRCDVRGLAAMYSGFQSPLELRASGFADGDDAALASASAVFAGPSPWMADHF